MRNGRIYLYVDNPGWNRFTLGTLEDLKEAGIVPEEGMKLKFYNDDTDEHGRPDDLVFEGTIRHLAELGWGAIPDERSFRHQSDERCHRPEPLS